MVQCLLYTEDLIMMGADYVFISVKGCHPSCQEGEQLCLVVVDAQKLQPALHEWHWMAQRVCELSSLSCCPFQPSGFREDIHPTQHLLRSHASAETGCMVRTAVVCYQQMS